MERKNTISGDETAGMVFVSYYGDGNIPFGFCVNK